MSETIEADLPEAINAADLLAYHDPLERKITINRRKRTITFRLAYRYEVDLDRIRSERDLLEWTAHLCEKDWMTTDALSMFIEKVCEYKRFNPKFESFLTA